MSTWIKGYDPNWVSDKAEAIALLDSYATKWLGHAIEETWVGMIHSPKAWWADFPIILKIAGVQYEICWWKFDELAITENQINVRNCWAGSRVAMRKKLLPALNQALGKRILAIELGESEMSFGASPMRIINSVNFILEGGYLTIFNGLDENGLSDRPCDHDIQRNFTVRMLSE